MGHADDTHEDRAYRDIIDGLVKACREGQGQVGPRRAHAGVWNANATATELPDQHEVNLLLGRMPNADRTILARILQEAFESGVHSALVTLHEAGLAPFDRAYEGSPFHDFVGRLNDHVATVISPPLKATRGRVACRVATGATPTRFCKGIAPRLSGRQRM
jgi:uncharacterized protein DUF6547